MSGRHHAITVLGHGPVNTTLPAYNKEVRYSWDMIQCLVVADDNYLPYKMVNQVATPYSIRDIDAFIVPLPEKIYYPAEDVMAFTEQVLNAGALGSLDLSFITEPVIRCFLTTSSSFKEFMRKNIAGIPIQLYMASQELPLPQFVWVVEVSTPDDWENKQCCARFILDATASKYEVRPFFIVHDQKGALIYDRASTGTLSHLDFGCNMLPQPLFTNNLLHF